MEKEKLEQLRTVFEKEIKIIRGSYFQNRNELNDYIKNKAAQLVYEVKIRINNQEVNEMTNLEWLEKMKKINMDSEDGEQSYHYRKLKALEIIAEELVRLNNENLNWKL